MNPHESVGGVVGDAADHGDGDSVTSKMFFELKGVELVLFLAHEDE